MSTPIPYGEGDGDRDRDHLPAPSHDRPLELAAARSTSLSVDLRPEEPRDGDETDLLAYWRILVKRRWTVLAALGIVLMTVLVATLLMTPIYRATTTLQLERETLNVVNVEGVTPVESLGQDFFLTQYELLKSRSLAERVASQVGLDDGKRIDRLLPKSPWQALRDVVAGGSADPDADGADSQAADSDAATAFIQHGLTIEPVRNSRLVRVHFDSPDRELSQEVANAYAQAFIASNLERRFESSAYAKSYLEDRLQELKLKLEDSERQLVEFAQQEQIVDTGGEAGSDLTSQNLSAVNAALAAARQERIRTQARWQQAQASRGLAMFGTTGENSIIQALQERRATLMADYQDKLGRFKPAYPEMVQLKAQIDELDRQIATEIGNIKGAIQAEFLAAQEQERMLEAQMTENKAAALDLQNRSIQYNIFRREVDTNRQLYEGLLQRYKEIGVAGGVSSNNISIVDPAEQGAKYRPSLALNLAVGVLAGLMLGILLALAFEYVDDSLKSPEDVEKQLGLAILGIIPLLRAPMTPAKALEDPRSAFAEAYRSVRTALQFSTPKGVPKVLLVTSASPSEGKSTTALTLARNFTLLGKRVLIIDADLRNPSLHKAIHVDNSVGLSNYLAGAAKALDVIQCEPGGALHYMPSGPLPPNPAELLMCAKMMSLLKVAADKFDQVIIDGPPVMGLADSPILGNMAHGTLLVIEAGSTRVAVAKHALKRLLAARTHVIGALLTKFSAKHAGHEYGYGGYSYYSYGGKEEPKRLANR